MYFFLEKIINFHARIPNISSRVEVCVCGGGGGGY